MTTGSGLERHMACAAAAVLPRIWEESGAFAARGTEVHAHLERVSRGMDPAESLARVDEEHREAAAAVDLDALAPELALSSEVSLAYDPTTDTARVLGQSTGRDYSSVAPDEVPMTLDLAGVAPDRVIAGDYKTGHVKVTAAADNWQMRGGALAMSRAFGRTVADVQLITIREGRRPWRDRATFDALDLAGFAAELRASMTRVARDRARYAAGEHVEPTEGPWCRYCPSVMACPAKTSAVRVALDIRDNLPITAADAGAAWEAVERGERVLKTIKSKLIALASHDPMMLRIEPDGSTVWLGRHEKPGKEKLDAEIAIDAAAAALGVDDLSEFTREIAGLDVTKAAIERAVKARGRKVAPTMNEILETVRSKGGARREVKETIGIFTKEAPAP